MDVSIVVVSFNTKNILLTCLDSIFKFTKKVKFEVIVVDNNSTDGTLEALGTRYGKKIVVLKNRQNQGFARGNNQGINIARGKYILLLNSDTELISDSISTMCGLMDNNYRVGIASCMLISSAGAVQASGGHFPSLFKIFLWATFIDDLPFIYPVFGSYHPHTPNYLNSSYYLTQHEQDWVTGAFFLIRKEVIKSVGLLDDDFFMYVEELEYCYRIKKAGWKVLYSPITQIIHIGGASGLKENAIIGEIKGLGLFYKKHNGFVEQVLLQGMLKIAALFRLVAFGVMLDFRKAKIYAKAFVSN